MIAFVGLRAIVAVSVSEAATSYEVHSLRGLEYLTYSLWSIFPVIHYAYYSGQIDWLQVGGRVKLGTKNLENVY